MRQKILSVASELKPIDNAIAVAKLPWIFPLRRNPGRHVSRLNNAQDRLCEKAQGGRRRVEFGSLRLHHNSLHAWPKRGLASRHSRKSASSSATFIRRLSTRRALCSGTKRLRWLGPRPYRPSGSIEARFFIKFLLNPRGPNHARVQAGRGETLK